MKYINLPFHHCSTQYISFWWAGAQKARTMPLMTSFEVFITEKIFLYDLIFGLALKNWGRNPVNRRPWSPRGLRQREHAGRSAVEEEGVGQPDEGRVSVSWCGGCGGWLCCWGEILSWVHHDVVRMTVWYKLDWWAAVWLVKVIVMRTKSLLMEIFLSVSFLTDNTAIWFIQLLSFHLQVASLWVGVKFDILRLVDLLSSAPVFRRILFERLSRERNCKHSQEDSR